MPTVDVVYLEWGSKNRDANLPEILRIVRVSGLRLADLVVVDNKGECKAVEHHNSICLNGDNMAREFSGWDRGIAYLREKGSSSDVLLLFNDTFTTHRRVRLTRRLRIAKWMKFAAEAKTPILFGQLDPTVRPNLEHPLGNICDFICSYFFGLNKTAIIPMTPLCEYEGLFDKALQCDRKSKEELSLEVGPKYRRHIREFYHDPGYWKAAEPLRPDNFDFFRLKVKSVLYEHSLALRARERGVDVCDICSGVSRLDAALGNAVRLWIKFSALINAPIKRIRAKIIVAR